MGGIISNLRINHQRVPIKSDFSFGQILGIGGFGIVREIRRVSTNEWFISKEFNLLTIIKYKNSLSTVILNELSSLKSLSSHQFIIKLYAAFRDSNSVFFVMDLLSGGDLRLHIRLGEQFSDFQTSYVIGCIGSALQHIHSHGIIHRDVKPENIMFDRNGIPKLIDFGISFINPSSSFSSSSNICICQEKSGTASYLAPEIFVPNTHYHSFESDFWSLGVVMYELLFRCRPFKTTVTLPMISFSKDTYKLAWESLINLSKTQFTSSTTSAAISTSATIGNGPSLTSPQIFVPGLYDIHESKSNFSNITHVGTFLPQFDNNTPLSHNLVVSIPQTNTAKEVTSSECQSLLLSLLDIRIHLRYGVNERYGSFINHPWFELNEFSRNKVFEYVPTPPNATEISDIICGKFIL